LDEPGSSYDRPIHLDEETGTISTHFEPSENTSNQITMYTFLPTKEEEERRQNNQNRRMR